MTMETSEVPSPLLDLFAKFSLQLDSMNTQLKRANELEQRKLAMQPDVLTKVDVFNSSATTYVHDFDGPQDGRIWHVRLLGCVALPFAANAAIPTFYVGTNVSSGVAGVPAFPPRWQFPSVPGFQKFSAGEIMLYPKEHLLLGLTSIPASSTIMTVVTINSEPMKRARPVVLEG